MVVTLAAAVGKHWLGRFGRTVSGWLPAIAALNAGLNVPVAFSARLPLL
jgi:hypothetical protein